MAINSKKRTNLVIFMCWLLYTCSYLGKYSYSTNVNSIIEYYGQTKTATSLVATLFFFAYGSGQIISGMICRYINKQYMVGGALFVSAFCNALIYFGIPFIYIKYLWFLNGLALSVLWSSIVLFISENISKKDFPKVLALLGTTTSVGTAIAYGTSSLFVSLNNFKLSFAFGFLVLSVVGALWILLYNKMKKGENENFDDGEVQISKKKSFEKYQGKIGTFIIIIICLFSLINIVNSFLRDGLTTWVPNLLKEEYDIPDNFSILLSMFITLAGVLGVVVANKLASNKLSDFLIVGIFFFGDVLLILGIILLSGGSWIFVFVAVALINSCAHGISNYTTGIIPLKYGVGKTFNSGMLAGVLNGFCYIGATISMYLFGWILDNSGWNAIYTVSFTLCGVMLAVCIIMLCVYSVRKRKINKSV